MQIKGSVAAAGVWDLHLYRQRPGNNPKATTSDLKDAWTATLNCVILSLSHSISKAHIGNGDPHIRDTRRYKISCVVNLDYRRSNQK